MKQLRKLATLFLVAALVIGTLFIPEQANAATKKPGIKESSVKLTAGESKTLTLQNTKGLKVKWSSGNKSVATVTQKGKVKAKKAGRANIFVHFSKKDSNGYYVSAGSDSCWVTVSAKAVAEKTVKVTCPESQYQTQIHVKRTVTNAPFEITISTKSEDENLGLTVYEATSGYQMKQVGTIDSNTKELTLTATKTIIIKNNNDTEVDVTVKVKTKDGKKTITGVTVS